MKQPIAILLYILLGIVASAECSDKAPSKIRVTTPARWNKTTLTHKKFEADMAVLEQTFGVDTRDTSDDDEPWVPPAIGTQLQALGRTLYARTLEQ